MAGGGMKVGQVIGETDPLGEGPKERPVHFQDVVATLYHNLGINVEMNRVEDHSGRPTQMLEHLNPIPELVG